MLNRKIRLAHHLRFVLAKPMPLSYVSICEKIIARVEADCIADELEVMPGVKWTCGEALFRFRLFDFVNWEKACRLDASPAEQMRRVRQHQYRRNERTTRGQPKRAFPAMPDLVDELLSPQHSDGKAPASPLDS